MPGDLRVREIFDDTVVVTYTVDDGHAGVRADHFLKDQYKRKSRNELQKAIDDGRITLVGKRLKASTLLQSGDKIKVTSKKNTEEPLVDFNYKIAYEDEDLMVVDKPGNLPVHPAGRFIYHTLLTTLKHDRKEWISVGNTNPNDDRNLYLIHRLDRETSGLIIIAKKKTMATELIEQFSNRETEKKYFAIANGIIEKDEFTVNADIGSAVGDIVRLKMKAYDPGHGKDIDNPLNPHSLQSAQTDFKVLARKNGMTLLDCTLKTGRQHQIRVHLSHIGHYVMGDKLYGPNQNLFLEYIVKGEFTEQMNEELGFERHALHSRSLKFFHPSKNEWMTIESELPDDMKNLLENH